MSEVIIIGATVGALVIFFLYKAIDILKKKPQNSFLGQIAIAMDDFGLENEGFVRFHGEYWKAQSKERIVSGQRVKIVNRKGLLLYVEPTSDQ